MKKWIISMAMLLVATSAQAVTLKIATLVPDGTAWMEEFKKAAAEVKEKTEGRVKLKFFPGGVMGSDKQVMRKMRIGQLHGGALAAGSLADLYNGFSVYGMPFLFKNHDEVRHVRPMLDADVAAGLEKKGMILLGISEGGFAYLMADKALRTDADLRSQKVWVPEGDVISQSVFESAGVAPVSLPISDVYTGLQTGLINTVGINPTGAIALQWHTKVKAVTDEPLLFIMGTMVVSQRAFKKIGSEDQQIVKRVVAAAFARLDQDSYQSDLKAREALKGLGVEFVALSNADRQKWREIAEQSEQLLADKSIFPAELLGKVKTSLAAFRAEQKK